MPATKIIFKRSSLLGKRPTNQLEPGEIGLNTNSTEPGLFFNTTDGRVVKVGPTSVLPSSPVDSPERGEMWLNVSNGVLNIGDARNLWRAIAAPYLGGGGNVFFAAPEFQYSSDSVLNDGQTLPFQTLTRAILEVTKRKIRNKLSGKIISDSEKKFVIYASASCFTANNGPGKSLSEFTTVFDEESEANVSIEQLVEFNSVEGSIIIPGGTSIKGFDLKKTVIRPTYVPTYRHPALQAAFSNDDQPLSSVFKVSGNVYCESFSVEDKVSLRNVNDIQSVNSVAVFKTSEPHGLSRNDKVYVKIAPTVNQTTGTFVDGYYYVRPLTTFEFQLAVGDLDDNSINNQFVMFSSLPKFGELNYVKLIVTNELKSAHRLSAFRYASKGDLIEYYTKVQRAFPVFFGGQVADARDIVEDSETVIVAPTDTLYPNNFSSNSTVNSSCYIRQVNVKSDYGMCWGDFDGDEVEGFRSLITNECTAVSIQKDPAAYEIYTTISDPETGIATQKWWTLAEATFYSLPDSDKPSSINELSSQRQWDLLNQTPIENIRYYYENLKSADNKSYGIVSIDRDFRHFGFRVRNSSYAQAQSVYTIGCAIGVWALNGGYINLTNSTSNFGSVAFKSEGFKGINTIGGSSPNLRNFLFNGIQRPLTLSKAEVLNPDNKRILSLGSKVIGSEIDPENPDIQILTLSSNFIPCYILPHSLKPGTAIWVPSGEASFRGYLADDGGPTVLRGSSSEPGQTAKIRVRASDSNIPTGTEAASALGVPYIRRFIDPRSENDRTYRFVFTNTSTEAISPPVGSVLRLNQSGQNISPATLKPNVQFDPGSLGGWGRLFTVDNSQVASLGFSPNFNYVVADYNQDNTYLVTLTLSDSAGPWLKNSAKSSSLPQGSYCTYANKNWYAAENNLWESVYYDVNFSDTAGPYKIAPVSDCSPYVATSALDKQELVSETFQGSYANDPNLTLLSGADLADYESGTYFRGSTVPYTEFGCQNYFDYDDGTEDMGLILKDQISGSLTTLTSIIDEDAIIPQPSFPPSYGSVRSAPQVVEFTVDSTIEIVDPSKQLTILKLTQNSNYEFMQILKITGNTIRASRLDSSNSNYPNPVGGSGDSKPDWTPDIGNPVVVNICEAASEPSVNLYDPDWANTKSCVFRFFEVMGYPRSTIGEFLTPRQWGERLFRINTLNSAPGSDGYALTTAEWPMEFNQPSTIIANTHTWAFCGYPLYSQGLPKFQTSTISRKLSYDFLCSTTWSGGLTVTGINEKGELVFFGPQREAVTSQFFNPNIPELNPIGSGSGSSGVIISPNTPPTNYKNGTLWWNSETGGMYVSYNFDWVQIGSSPVDLG